MADCLQVFLNNWSKLFQICEEYRVVIESPILLLRLAEQLFSRLKPIAIALDKAQADSANISTAFRIWAELEVVLNKKSEFKLDKDQRKKVIERKKQAITKYNFLANLVDPRERGNMRSDCEKNDILEWTSENHPIFVPILMKMNANATPYH